MAFPKAHLFPQLDQEISTFHRALGYPARIGILRILEDQGPKQVRDLVNLLPITEGAITEHMKKLREAGFVHVEALGLTNFYTIDKSGLLQMVKAEDKLISDLGVIQSVYLYRRKNW